MVFASGLQAGTCSAATIERLETAHHAGRYTVNFEVVLDAPHDRVWTLMTDYDQLPRLSDAIVASRVLVRNDDHNARLALDVRGCVLFFCRTLRQIADVQIRPKREIVVTTDPAVSDLRHAREHWRLAPESTERTRLRYRAEWEPAFYVPPLVGPVMIKYFLEREIQTTARRVEELAAHE